MRKANVSLTVLRKRLFAASAAIAFLFCLFLGRFFYVQLIWERDLIARAVDQWTRELPVLPERGAIYDRNGELLAGNTAAYTLYARANAVKEPEETARTLSSLLPLSYEALLSKLRDRSQSEIVLVKRTSKETVAAVEGTGLSGIYYARDSRRVYPYGSLACQVIGFSSSDGAGLTGIERQYDEYLAGVKGEIVYETDLVGAEIEGTGASYIPAEDGLSVTLTLDARIQSLAEEVMARALEEHGAKAARCIVLDPSDFSVLAMVNLPSYDLNDIPREDAAQLNALSRNALVSDVYEPGSTFKIVTAAADLEEYLRGNKGAYSPEAVFSSSRTRNVEGSTIRCWSDHKNGKHANLTLAGALNNSCNPCFVDIVLSLGKETFYDYLEKFHFGSATGIDFSGEAIGMLLPEATLKNSDLARIGFGQSIAVTPLQLACAAAAAVNGGYYYAPRLVKAASSENGAVRIEFSKRLLGRTVSEETSRLLSSMLEGVVKEGSGKQAYVEGLRVAGKTGTAQKYENGHIAAGKYVSSFVGYFPADEPRYLALVIVDEPQGSYYGSTVAAPCAGEIFRGIAEMMDISFEEVTH